MECGWSFGESAEPIGELIKALMRKKKFREKGKYPGLTRAWSELVGEGIAGHTKVREFSEGELVVEVDSSVLLHELNGFMKQRLLAGLQERNEARDVARLRFCLGSGRSDSE